MFQSTTMSTTPTTPDPGTLSTPSTTPLTTPLTTPDPGTLSTPSTTPDPGSSSTRPTPDPGYYPSKPNKPFKPNKPQYSSSPDPEVFCSQFGKKAHPKNCQKYLFCWISRYEVHSCSRNEAFDPKLNLCTKNWAPCSLVPTCSYSGQVFSAPNDDSAFLYCYGKKIFSADYQVYKRYCPNEQKFNAAKGICLW